jgi:PAS domain S-box-containing protein
MTAAKRDSDMSVCLALTDAISRTTRVEEIYEAALDALRDGLGTGRAAIQLYDADGVMRFKAWRGLSETYRRAVEGHTPWTPDSPHPSPIVVGDVATETSLAAYRQVIDAEGIAAMTFVPLVSLNRVIGKFMLYSETRGEPSAQELTLAGVIAAQVAFAVQRTIAEDAARRSEERLRFALEAASMATCEWDLVRNTAKWSDNLERVHGVPPGTFDGTFESLKNHILPEDRDRVMSSLQRAIETGEPHEVEFRVPGPDGTLCWVEAKGHVEYEDGRAVRITGVCMNVTRRKQAEIAQLQSVEMANRLKDEFLSALSHELRTPLNAIVGWVHMLQTSGVAPDRIERALDVIARNARLQTQLVEDMLDVSRIVMDDLQLERVAMDLPGVLEQAFAAVRPAADAARIQLIADVSPDLPEIEGDPRRVQQVLTNLLSNAIRFTPATGSIVVTCSASGKHVAIEIRDPGMGIDPALLPQVFERFVQADGATSRQQGGLGLGLAIAHHLVQQHGGRLTATSDGQGRGATFTLELPALTGLRRNPGATEGDRRRSQLEGTHILVVDEDPDARQLLKRLLEQNGADVAEAASSAEALAEVTLRAFELVLVDLALPGMDGYNLVAALKRMRPGMPALAVSAWARPIDRDRALVAGYDALETKPVDVARLIATARMCIRKSEV